MPTVAVQLEWVLRERNIILKGGLLVHALFTKAAYKPKLIPFCAKGESGLTYRMDNSHPSAIRTHALTWKANKHQHARLDHACLHFSPVHWALKHALCLSWHTHRVASAEPLVAGQHPAQTARQHTENCHVSASGKSIGRTNSGTKQESKHCFILIEKIMTFNASCTPGIDAQFSILLGGNVPYRWKRFTSITSNLTLAYQ